MVLMDTSLLNIDFEPLTAVKARLSEKVTRVDQEGRLLTITVNGKPKAILVPYAEFLTWLQERQIPQAPTPSMTFKQWEQASPRRRAVSRAILNLFDMKNLSRKGQKPYKREALRKFEKS